MTSNDIPDFAEDFKALQRRLTNLRATLLSPGGDDGSVLDAALLEIEAACEELHTCFDELGSQQQSARRERSRADREHQVLRQAFIRAPVPFCVLDRYGAIRRINTSAAALTGLSSEFSAGKPLSSLLELPARAPFRSHLAAVLRAERPMIFRCRLTVPTAPVVVSLVLTRIPQPTGEPPLALATVLAGDCPIGLPLEPLAGFPLSAAAEGGSADVLGGPRHEPASGAGNVNAVLPGFARALDLIGRIARLIICGDETGVLLPSAARLLATEFTDWAVIHLAGMDPDEAPIVDGPSSPLGMVRPWPAIVREVLDTGGPVLLDLADHEYAFGCTSSGTPVLSVIGAASLLCVALRTTDGNIGALTAIRMGGRPVFSLTDAAMLDEIGSHLGLALSR